MRHGKFKVSERQQIVIVLMLIVLAVFLFWKYGLKDLNEQRRKNERVRRQLENSGFADKTMPVMEASLAGEQDAFAELEGEWAEIERRVGAFSDQESLRKSNVLRIDYKVELNRTRARLENKARELEISLSAKDLGMSEEVFSVDDPRKLMLQLRAVEKLVDLTLDRRIQRLVSVKPMDPVEHHRRSDGRLMAEEFPVEVEVDVSFTNFHDFFTAVFEEGTVFVFRNIKIVSGSTPGAPLRVTAVMSALLFGE